MNKGTVNILSDLCVGRGWKGEARVIRVTWASAQHYPLQSPITPAEITWIRSVVRLKLNAGRGKTLLHLPVTLLAKLGQ